MDQLPTSNSQGTKTGSGCAIAGGVGCLVLGLCIAALFVIGGIVAFFIINVTDNIPEPTNVNFDTNYSNYNYNTNTNFIDGDTDAKAYQVYAYPTSHVQLVNYPSIRASIEHADMQPLKDDEHGFLWVGASLDNGYFVQVGLTTSQELDEAGNMQWNYFWEMWNDQGVYVEGEQASLDYADWDENTTNQFTLTCQDPEAGTWEFWVNDTTIGTTTTGDCETNLDKISLAWEVVTDKYPYETLPTFGPFKLNNLEYWDGENNWYAVEEAAIGYAYGLVSEGTVEDQYSVCPPYGAEGLKNGFRAGSTVTCLTNGELLWTSE